MQYQQQNGGPLWLRTLNRIRAKIYHIRHGSPIYLFSWTPHKDVEGIGKNFGDDLNARWLPGIINKKVVVNPDIPEALRPYLPQHVCVGSTICMLQPGTPYHVWGAGFISKQLPDRPLNLRVHAVRGPLSRNAMTAIGTLCDPVFGDPAMLLPRYYRPKAAGKTYEVGIVPHWRQEKEQAGLLQQLVEADKDVCLISLTRYDSWTDVVDRICACKRIVSSSLHGLIVADAYGIDNLWATFGAPLPQFSGGTYKFTDYLLSVGRTDQQPVAVNSVEQFRQALAGQPFRHAVYLPVEELLAACPFARHLRKPPYDMPAPRPFCMERMEADAPELSIIIPVHNSGVWLRSGLMSIFMQTYQDFEVILVDDGSTDNSPDICRHFEQTERRIRYFRQHNRGPGPARNLGLDHARGRFITFMDSDDGYLTPNTLQTAMDALRAAAQGGGRAVAQLGFHRYVGGKLTKREELCVGESGERRPAYIFSGGDIYRHYYLPFIWNKIFSRDMFDDLRFPTLAFSEDSCLSLQSLRRMRRLVCTTVGGYRYNIRSGSVSHSTTYFTQCSDNLFVYNSILTHLKRLGKRGGSAFPAGPMASLLLQQTMYNYCIFWQYTLLNRAQRQWLRHARIVHPLGLWETARVFVRTRDALARKLAVGKLVGVTRYCRWMVWRETGKWRM